MARLTVEDCLKKVGNRFELVLLASKRARQLLTGGGDPLVSPDGDKATVLALREIAAGLVKSDQAGKYYMAEQTPAQDMEEEISQEIIEETQQVIEPDTITATNVDEDGVG